MKKTRAVIVFILGAVAGLAVSHVHVSSVHAQISNPRPSYGVGYSSIGACCVSPGVQYIVNINGQRGWAGYDVYQVQSNPVPVDGTGPVVIETAQASLNAGFSMQAFKPGSTVNTFTLSATAP